MKSLKFFAGTLLCLMLLSGQALAVTTLDFDNIYDDYSGSLDRYGDSYGVTFEGWGLAQEDVDVGLMKRARAEAGAKTSIAFDYFPVSLLNFDIDLTGHATMTAEKSDGSTEVISFKKNFLLKDYTPEGWSGFLLKSISFDLLEGSTLFVDNVSFSAPVPLPGAAILFGSGLLGLVGLRRRQIV